MDTYFVRPTVGLCVVCAWVVGVAAYDYDRSCCGVVCVRLVLFCEWSISILYIQCKQRVCVCVARWMDKRVDRSGTNPSCRYFVSRHVELWQYPSSSCLRRRRELQGPIRIEKSYTYYLLVLFSSFRYSFRLGCCIPRSCVFYFVGDNSTD